LERLRYIVGLLPLLLSACYAVPVSSTLYVSRDLQNSALFERVASTIEIKSAETGGSCKRREVPQLWIQCSLGNFGDVDYLVAGTDEQGSSFVRVFSLGSSYFLISERQLRKGKVKARRHAEVEKWIFQTFDFLDPTTKIRRFSGRGVEIEIE